MSKDEEYAQVGHLYCDLYKAQEKVQECKHQLPGIAEKYKQVIDAVKNGEYERARSSLQSCPSKEEFLSKLQDYESSKQMIAVREQDLKNRTETLIR